MIDDSMEIQLHVQPAWEQRPRESKFQYAWFARYAELGPERTVEQAAKLCGVPVKQLRLAQRDHDWDVRAGEYDATVVEIQKAISPSETEALAIQYAAGTMMLKLAVKGIATLDPNMLRIKDIQGMLREGSDMVRRGAGIADLKVDHNIVERVQSDIELLLSGLPKGTLNGGE